MPQFNLEQQAAIDARGRHILVSAPAGSGKTRILVARISDLIVRDRYNITDFLVMTFTDAAANEMKQRLSETLGDLLSDESCDDNLRAHLQTQILNLPKAYISTFDSFCKRLLDEYGYLIGVMPGFKVNPTPESYLESALDECFNTWILDETFQDYASRMITNNSFDDLRDLLKKFLTVTNSYPDFNAVMGAEQARNYDPDHIEDAPLFALMRQNALQDVRTAANILARMCEFCINEDITPFLDPEEDSDIPSLMDQYKYDIMNRIDTLSDPHLSFEQFCRLGTQGLPQPRGKKTIPWKKLGLEDAKDTYNAYKKNINTTLQYMMPGFEPADMPGLLTMSWQDIDYLLGENGLLAQFRKVYGEKMRRDNQLDFHDLEDYATKLLSDDYPIVSRLNQSLREIMVDEYQDTNAIQENLVNRIAHHGGHDVPVFQVGDMKQSIYRFRQADPAIFKEKFDTYAQSYRDNGQVVIPDEPQVRIDLQYNYRSHKPVLDAINYIFDALMDKDLGDLEYYRDTNAILHYDLAGRGETLDKAAAKGECVTELLLANMNKDREKDKDETEAHLVAQRIQRMVDKRECQYGDIAILMRSTTAFPTFKRVFEDYGIPADILLSKGLFGTNEAKALMALLKALVNPYDDLSLLSVLHSRFAFSNFDENELLALRTEDAPLIENVRDANTAKTAKFMDTFLKLRQIALTRSPYETLRACLDESEFQVFVSGLVNGAQRSANIDALLELARTTSVMYTDDFLDLTDAGLDASTGIVASDENNAVHFMTIHKSKGLQFKVVFVCQMHKRFNHQDEKNILVMEKGCGIASKARMYMPASGSRVLTEFDNPFRQAIIRQMHKATLDEEMRLLYVALTRAAEKIVMTGVINDPAELHDMAEAVIEGTNDPALEGDACVYTLESRKPSNPSYLKWVLLALMRHPDVIKDLRSIDPELWAMMSKLSPSLYKGLTNDDTILAKFHFDVTDGGDVEAKIPASARKKHEDIYPSYKRYYEFTYKHEDKPRSVAVTTLQKLEDEKHFDYINAESLSRDAALSLGTLVHNLLETFTFEGDDVDERLDAFLMSGTLTEEEANLLTAYKPRLETFVQSDVYQVIARAQKMWKEKPFRYKDPSGMVINGIFDLVFLDEHGQLCVLDYKTDRITTNASLDKLVKKHKVQLDLYKHVLGLRFHTDVKGYVYYLQTGQNIEV